MCVIYVLVVLLSLPLSLSVRLPVVPDEDDPELGVESQVLGEALELLPSGVNRGQYLRRVVLAGRLPRCVVDRG